MQNEHDVFISYSHKDKKVADAICANLELNGIKCWYAPRNIVSGEDWASSIVKAIGKAKVFVLVFSEYSNGSEQVMNEVSAAFNAGCVVIPFKIKDIDMSAGLYYYLNRVHWFDAVSLPLEKNIKQLCEQIKPLIIEPQSNFKSAPEPVSAPKPKPQVDNLKNKKMIPAAALAVVFVLVLLGLLLKKPAQSEENILMEDSSLEEINDVYRGTVLGSDISRDSIVSVTFLDTLDDAPDTAWDASREQDGTVKAWAEQDAVSPDKYDLFIGADGGVKAENCYRLFRGYYNLEEIEFNGCFDTSKATNMVGMFYDCSSLTALDVSSFDTSHVTDMSSMFYNCSSLTKLDLSNFDTSAAEDMKNMFCGCENLIVLDVGSFDTSHVTDMSSMFEGCVNLAALDVSSFKTDAVTDMMKMFRDCTNLVVLDVSGFDTSAVKNMESMFYECSSLAELNVSSFDTSQVVGMRWMFYNCTSLKELDVSNFDTSAAENMKSMFGGCENLTELDVSGFDTNKVTDMSFIFRNCRSLITLDVSGFNTSKVTNMKAMFIDCKSLSKLDVSGFNTSQVTDMSWMFNKCLRLTELDASSFDTSAAENMGHMFQFCGSLISLDVSGFNINTKTDTTDMYRGCSFSSSGLKVNRNVLRKENAAQKSDDDIWQGTVLGSKISRDKIASVTFMDSLDLMPDDGWWDVSLDEDGTVIAWTQENADNRELYDLFIGAAGGVKGQDCSWLFGGYYNTEKIDFNNSFDTSALINTYCMFYDCKKLKQLDVSDFDTKDVTNMSWMFAACESLTKLDVSNFDTRNVTSLRCMFGTCKSVDKLDVSNFDTGNVTDMGFMFSHCEALTELDVSGFDMSQVTDMENMFSNCGITAEKAGLKVE